MVNLAARRAALACLAVIGLVAAGCAAGLPASAAPSNTPNVGSAPPIASPSPIATAALSSPVETASPFASPSGSAASAPVPDGDYVSGLVTCAMSMAILNVPKFATNSDVQSFLGGCRGADPQSGASGTLRFAAGQWTAFGGDGSVGDNGTYAFANGHTMILQDNAGCLNTLTFSLHGKTLKLTPIKESCGAASLAIWQVIYGSTPWVRKP
jgi:hypothetical protein